MSDNEFSHIDDKGRPTMVDVSDKTRTARSATARAVVTLPRNAADALRAGGNATKKGPVFDTAIVAGVMAAKRTHELIPFCHPLGLENCSIDIRFDAGGDIVIDCTTTVCHKTGVEMEALTGATVAALTVYDMCKALTHQIVIGPVRLLEKTGGKSDYRAEAGP